MRKQMQAMGLAVDWSERLPPATRATTSGTSGCFENAGKGIAYRKTQGRQLGPGDQTVLANEQA
jgi:leucyl-tRNA synthetase